ncbi:hypothetical protein Ade02nite_18850 [Paractinoplanes deccanensis]|uniref:Resolvase/invertase-type recombinase catalytic domain-containing protein n=1 Tax=Paractinoplanes deccanensis TaxID=113561 RepID=A0ABQ3XZU0_9ACTN|nr:recombinase family protein [Actinoplanes deccanensis]GID73244.1 hypothetical protein Ade02nite_18850 [Actinoplanes deccanensis]
MRSDLYARKSTTDLGRSVARQERAWRADCATNDIEAGRVFVDPDLSASRYARKDRPDYAALLVHIEAGNARMISLLEVTRGSRRMREWVDFLDLCRDLKVLIRIFGNGDEEEAQTYQPWRQKDRDFLMREGMAAEGEVEKLRARTMAGTADAAHEGRPGGPLIDGYKRVYGSFTDDSVSLSGSRRRVIQQVVDEPRAAIYRAAAEGVINGVPLEMMARILNAWQVPTASGTGRWRGAVLRRALLSPALQGHRVLRGEITRRNAWPAVVEPNLAARVQAVLETRGRRHRSDGRLKYLLSGALRCPVCGVGLNGQVWKNRPPAYVCVTPGCHQVGCAIRLADAEVSQLIVARLIQQDAMSAPAFHAAVDDVAVRAVDEELRALNQRVKELHREAALPDGPSFALVASTERALNEQIGAAQERRRRLVMPPALDGFDPQDLARKWYGDDYTVGEKRAVVMGLADLVLSRVGKAGRWSKWRLAESRWRGDELTWGEHWEAQGEQRPSRFTRSADLTWKPAEDTSDS